MRVIAGDTTTRDYTVTVTRQAAGAQLDPPGNVVYTPTNTGVAVSWTAVTGANRHVVQYCKTSDWTAGSGCSPVAHKLADGAGASSMTVTGLENGTSYQMRMRAEDTTDGRPDSDYTDWTQVTPLAQAPDAPTGLSVSAADAQLDLTWTAPSDNGGSALTGYDVHYTSALVGTVADNAAVQTGGSPSPAAGWVAVNRGTEADPPAASQAITGLTNDQAYRVRVRAKNAQGAGGWLSGTGTPGIDQSANADLSALTASTSTSSGGTFDTLDIGAFATGTTAYTGSVEYAQTHVKVTPTVAATGTATVGVRKGSSGGFTPVASGSQSSAIALGVGANALTVRVTAGDRTTTKDYTVTVTRGPQAPRRGDAHGLADPRRGGPVNDPHGNALASTDPHGHPPGDRDARQHRGGRREHAHGHPDRPRADQRHGPHHDPPGRRHRGRDVHGGDRRGEATGRHHAGRDHVGGRHHRRRRHPDGRPVVLAARPGTGGRQRDADGDALPGAAERGDHSACRRV